MDSCLDVVGGAKYITVADIVSTFWKFPVAAKDVDKVVFVTPFGKHVFLRM